MSPVAVFHSPFPTKFGIPRQAGVVSDIPGTIIFEKPFRTPDAIRGLEGFDYIWIIWQAISASSSPTVRPPRLGGNTRVGVFASRSPLRPNPIGLSSVRIDHIEYDAPEGPVIHVTGADIMDGTPILDIKPYIPYADSHPEASGGFTDLTEFTCLRVEFPDELLSLIEENKRAGLISVLESDPRGAYEKQPGYTYGMSFGRWDIRFTVNGDILTVTEVVMI